MQRATLGKPAELVLGLQPLYNGLFDDGLAVRHRVELAGQAAACHGEGILLSQKPLPGQSLYPLEQLLKGAGGKLPQQQEHPLPKAAAEVGTHHGLPAAGKQHPAVLRLDLLQPHIPQLLGHQALHPKQAGHAKSHVPLHSSSFSQLETAKGGGPGRVPSAVCLVGLFIWTLAPAGRSRRPCGGTPR